MAISYQAQSWRCCQIGGSLGVPASTVHRVLVRCPGKPAQPYRPGHRSAELGRSRPASAHAVRVTGSVNTARWGRHVLGWSPPPLALVGSRSALSDPEDPNQMTPPGATSHVALCRDLPRRTPNDDRTARADVSYSFAMGKVGGSTSPRGCTPLGSTNAHRRQTQCTTTTRAKIAVPIGCVNRLVRIHLGRGPV
jgi:hypothetical protein